MGRIVVPLSRRERPWGYGLFVGAFRAWWGFLALLTLFVTACFIIALLVTASAPWLIGLCVGFFGGLYWLTWRLTHGR